MQSFKKTYSSWADNLSYLPVYSGLALNYGGSAKQAEAVSNKTVYGAYQQGQLVAQKDSLSGWEFTVKDDLNSLRKGWSYRQWGSASVPLSVDYTKLNSVSEDDSVVADAGAQSARAVQKLSRNGVACRAKNLTSRNSRLHSEVGQGLAARGATGYPPVSEANEPSASERASTRALSTRSEVTSSPAQGLRLAQALVQACPLHQRERSVLGFAPVLLTEVPLRALPNSQYRFMRRLKARKLTRREAQHSLASGKKKNAGTNAGLMEGVTAQNLRPFQHTSLYPQAKLGQSPALQGLASRRSAKLPATVLSMMHPAESQINTMLHDCPRVNYNLAMSSEEKPTLVIGRGAQAKVQPSVALSFLCQKPSFEQGQMQKTNKNRASLSAVAAQPGGRAASGVTPQRKRSVPRLDLVKEASAQHRTSVKQERGYGWNTKNGHRATLQASLISLCGVIGYLPARESISYIAYKALPSDARATKSKAERNRKTLTTKHQVNLAQSNANLARLGAMSISHLGQLSIVPTAQRLMPSTGEAPNSAVFSSKATQSESIASRSEQVRLHYRSAAQSNMSSQVPTATRLSLLHSFPYTLAIKQAVHYVPSRASLHKKASAVKPAQRGLKRKNFRATKLWAPPARGQHSLRPSIVMLSEKAVYSNCVKLTTKLLKQLQNKNVAAT